MRSLLLTLTLLFTTCIYAQGPADWWYFGVNAGLNFPNSVNPAAVINGQLNTNEGCASISDQQGNLLFYTDGSTIYDRNHLVMPNGTGLTGNSSSTQSAVIVPFPFNNNMYYVFTIFNTLSYSVVDLSLNSGNGAVVVGQKNILMTTGTTEKLTACENAAGNGYWVFTHLSGNASFHAYEVTTAGVNLTPVVSTVGATHASNIGYMKTSPDGNRLAIAGYFNSGTAEVFDLNNATGTVSNPITLTGPWTNNLPYGVEFSSSSDVLYIHETTNGGGIHQYNLTLGSAAAINASKFLVHSQTGVFGAALQLGPDNKIYCAHWGNTNLSVINDPDVLGAGCNFTLNQISLAGKISRLGLPTFIQSFFATDFDFEFTCFGDSTRMWVDTASTDSAFWNFGDPNSGANNTAEGLDVRHVFSDTGLFSVSVIAYQDTLVDSQTHEIYIYPQPVLDLGNDTALCVGFPITFDVTQPHATYLWHDGSTDSALTVTQDSVVSVTVYGVCDTLTDTVLVNFFYPFPVDLGPDTSICFYDSLLLDPNLPTNLTYAWSTNAITPQYLTLDSGTISITVTDSGGCSYSDTVTVAYLPQLSVDLGPDDLFCYQDSVAILPVTLNTTQYSWSTGAASSSISVQSTGTYTLTVSDGFCTASDSVFYELIFYPIADLGNDTSYCIGESITLSADLQNAGVSYLWNTTESDPTINASVAGTYWVEVSDNNCSMRDTVVIGEYAELSVSLGETLEHCEGDTVTVQVTSSGPITEFLWNNGDSGQVQITTENSHYEVTVSNGLCSASAEVNVFFFKVPEPDLGADTNICKGDTLRLSAVTGLQLETYRWYHGSKEATQTFRPDKPTTVWVEVKNRVCTASDSMLLGLRPTPEVKIEDDTTICPEQFVLLIPDTSNLMSYEWSTGDVEPFIEAQEAQTYTLTASDGFCIGVDSMRLTHRNIPTISLEAPDYYCLGDEIVLEAFDTDFLDYLWQNRSRKPSMTVDSAGTYYVSARHHCGYATDTITIASCECELWAPTAFIPDGNGRNDGFRIEADCQFISYSLRIYDRWGHELFRSNNPEVFWNGERDNIKSPIGSYVWRLEYTGIREGQVIEGSEDGVLNLLR